MRCEEWYLRLIFGLYACPPHTHMNAHAHKHIYVIIHGTHTQRGENKPFKHIFFLGNLITYT